MAKFNISVEVDWLEEDGSLDQIIKDEIVGGVAEKVIANLTQSMESEATQIVKDKMAELDASISDKLNSMMEEFFNTPKDITDRWGNVKERGITVTQKLAEACDNFLSQSVDDGGKPASGYSAKYDTRVDYIVHKSIDHNMEWAIQRAVSDVTDNLKKRISGEIKKQMGEKLAGVVGLDDLLSNQ